jgi:hypothetical protein
MEVKERTELVFFHDRSISPDDIYTPLAVTAMHRPLPELGCPWVLSRFEVFVLTGQNTLHHKLPKFSKGK